MCGCVAWSEFWYAPLQKDRMYSHLHTGLRRLRRYSASNLQLNSFSYLYIHFKALARYLPTVLDENDPELFCIRLLRCSNFLGRKYLFIIPLHSFRRAMLPSQILNRPASLHLSKLHRARGNLVSARDTVLWNCRSVLQLSTQARELTMVSAVGATEARDVKGVVGGQLSIRPACAEDVSRLHALIQAGTELH